ncbi:hypothetical protein EJ04DRAFT_243268 [Polyplosphaeria fusca]|uniref:Uncharacterized protein n=1 Tax=Polyplosphaeria fusca TaxID=682080 RepID=A0A9P4QVC8_9PLEO|nr:hypothetical protein EJ04DRAFT_243268 [Polyplosphaeria fusca]
MQRSCASITCNDPIRVCFDGSRGASISSSMCCIFSSTSHQHTHHVYRGLSLIKHHWTKLAFFTVLRDESRFTPQQVQDSAATAVAVVNTRPKCQIANSDMDNWLDLVVYSYSTQGSNCRNRSAGKPDTGSRGVSKQACRSTCPQPQNRPPEWGTRVGLRSLPEYEVVVEQTGGDLKRALPWGDQRDLILTLNHVLHLRDWATNTDSGLPRAIICLEEKEEGEGEGEEERRRRRSYCTVPFTAYNWCIDLTTLLLLVYSSAGFIPLAEIFFPWDSQIFLPLLPKRSLRIFGLGHFLYRREQVGRR